MPIPQTVPQLSMDPEDDIEAQLAQFGITLEDLMHEIGYRHKKKVEQAIKTQRLAAKVNSERRTVNFYGNGGEVAMQIHPVFYHYWGQRLGYECWDKTRNPEFAREMLRDNPELRVKTHTKPGLETGAMIANRAKRRGPVGRRGRWAA